MDLQTDDYGQLRQTAALIRADVLKMTTAAGSGHPGGSLSASDIMVMLYFGGVLRYDPENPDWPARDRFILSKGHVAPVLYATLARAGYFPLSELASLRQFGSRLQGHPDKLKLPGVEASAGSLGQGLSIACGLAYALAKDHLSAGLAQDTKPRVYVLLGDGECQEGQVWEAAMFAAHHRLSNLVAIIDNNGLQIDGAVSAVCDVGDLAAKFSEFGWQVSQIDGHDFVALQAAFATAANQLSDSRPQVIVAQTIKGKGVSFMEGKAEWHGKSLSTEQLEAALAELAPLLDEPAIDISGD
ncbi:MAG: transketolase [Coriobacteriales bacterium]|nr:transketolase [Coriobacteriales bacterium]